MKTRDIVLAALMIAFTTALGMVKITLPISNGVPITGQTLGVMLAGALLGARLGGLSIAAFVILVAAGAPLLSGFHGGLGIFASPSGGWVLSWPFAAFLIGFLVERSWNNLRSWKVFLFNIIGGIVLVYAIGIGYQIALTGMPLPVVLVQSATYVPGDLIKSFVAAVIAVRLRHAYPLIRRTERAEQRAA